MLSVEFRNFWPGFNTEDNIFLSLITNSEEIQRLSELKDTRIVFYSVFSRFRKAGFLLNSLAAFLERISSGLSSKNLVILHYSGELDFPGWGFDSYFGYRHKRIVYWPLWVTYCSIDSRDFVTDRGPSVPMSKLLVSQYVDAHSRERVACTFISNMGNRERMILGEQLNQLGVLDLYGAAFNKKVENKDQVARRYSFEFCSENKDYPGYVSEKVIESWLNGCIPIYSGNDKFEYLNSNAYIDSNSKNAIEIETMVKSISANHTEGTYLLPPILSRPFNLNVLELEIIRILKKKARTSGGATR